MRRIDLYFLLLATLSLVAGVSLGIWMGIVHDFQFMPVHAHLNLLGWASLALFGLVYKSYPVLARSRLAVGHFALCAVSAVVFPVGIALSISNVTIAVAILGSFLWLGGALLFLANLARLILARPGDARARAGLNALGAISL